MVFVTDDNPRHEDAADIRAAIMDTCPMRPRLAIGARPLKPCLTAAQADDLVLLAGKGHESGQIIGDIILPFDDVTMAQSILASKEGTMRDVLWHGKDVLAPCRRIYRITRR